MRRYQDPGVVAGWILEQPFARAPVITHCGATLCDASHRVPRHVHQGAEIMYLISGQVTWSARHAEFRQRQGEVFIVGGNVPHATARVAHPRFRVLFAGLELSSSWDADREVLAALERHGGVLPAFPAIELEPVLDGLYALANEERPHSPEVPEKYAELLVALIRERLGVRGPTSADNAQVSPEVGEVIAHLRDNLHRRVPVSEMAEVANLSARQLASRFGADLGVSPGRWHGLARLGAARLALSAPGASVTTVAHDFGFSSAQHFSTAFRHAFGTSPRMARHRAAARTGTGGVPPAR